MRWNSIELGRLSGFVVGLADYGVATFRHSEDDLRRDLESWTRFIHPRGADGSSSLSNRAAPASMTTIPSILRHWPAGPSMDRSRGH